MVGIESIQAHHVNIIQLETTILRLVTIPISEIVLSWPQDRKPLTGPAYPVLSDRQYDSGGKVGRCSSLHSVHLQGSVSVVLRPKGKRSASSTHGIFQRRCGIRYRKYIHFLLCPLLHLLTGTWNKPEVEALGCLRFQNERYKSVVTRLTPDKCTRKLSIFFQFEL